MKLMIAVPSTGTIQSEFVKSLLALTRRLDRNGVDFDVRFQSGTLVYIARDELAKQAIDEGFSHMLWLDSDMVFDADVFEKLSWHRLPFICGLYRSRHGNHVFCALKKQETLEVVDGVPDKIFQIHACGFGCVLLDTRILKQMRMMDGNLFLPTREFGEDFAFCERAGKMGFHIYCDPTIRIGHIGATTFWPES